MNFSWDGLQQAATALDRVHGFAQRLAEVDREGPLAAEVEQAAAKALQAFDAALLREAHLRATTAGIAATDDAALVERLGVRVRLVAGLPGNVKITRPEDLPLARALLASRLRGRRRSRA